MNGQNINDLSHTILILLRKHMDEMNMRDYPDYEIQCQMIDFKFTIQSSIQNIKNMDLNV